MPRPSCAVRSAPLPPVKALDPVDLRTCCDPAVLDFTTTDDLAPVEEIIGQDRAVEAIAFGIGIPRRGFNVFAHGPSGHGKLTAVERFLDRHAITRPPGASWCYVHNFDEAHRPRPLRLPPGQGPVLRTDMARLVEDLLVALPAAFDNDAHQARRRRLSAEFEARARAGFQAASKEAETIDLAVVEGEDGLSVVPAGEGGPMPPEVFRTLSEERQAELRSGMDTISDRLDAAMRAARAVEREARRALIELDREVARVELDARLGELRERYGAIPEVLAYLDAVAGDVVDHLEPFRRPEDGGSGPGDGDHDDGAASAAEVSPAQRRRADPRLRRYAVNVLVDGGGDAGAPVIVETHPTLGNLVGRIEQEQRLGALVTDLTLIKAGALHRANGGYLVLQAEEVLKQSYAWDALKRALRNDQIRIETPGGDGAMSTVWLDPEPIPLSTKIVLVGDTGLYFALFDQDSEFPELFKVAAEFGSSMPRTDASLRLYARFLATVVGREGLLPLDRAAVARVIDHGARLAEDAGRLSTNFLNIIDLAREAEYLARRRDAPVVLREDVSAALAARVRRADLARELIHEDYARGIVLLETDGETVGQINGLTILDRGNVEFGLPVRVTARARLGGGEVLDIEREVELGGPIHSKGVLILSGLIAGRYLPDETLAMSASVTFEQSYHEIEGDSASSAELYAILSALANIPIKQSLAVTGSVNQAGEVQAIGGVNEKIEGYFDVCRLKGLTGAQGVVIPASNVQHLMLSDDVVAAVEAGQFSIFPVRHVDEGIEILTGVPAGARGADGEYPLESVNRRVEDRLRELAEKRRELGHGGPEEPEEDVPEPHARPHPRRSVPVRPSD